ncbi:MAG: hypothetical protein HZA93_15020 [Verrucomicrobia bacterium]|nr:hypothetical protein [Verrucomicrobiota bacterium]
MYLIVTNTCDSRTLCEGVVEAEYLAEAVRAARETAGALGYKPNEWRLAGVMETGAMRAVSETGMEPPY